MSFHPMSFLHTEADLQAGMAALVAQDPRLAPILELSGMPALRRREGGYAGLCAIVCGQQLSTASAAAIRNRLMATFDPFHHDTVRLARADKLKRLGLSNAKIKSIKAIGHAISKGQIDLDAVAAMEADQAHAALTALHGIGPWTADIYLLFCLGNADAWPAGDLAVQEAVRLALGLRKRPDAKAMIRLAEPWRPWRGVAAHLFWAYYRVAKRREGIEVTAKPETTKPEPTKPASAKPAPTKPAPTRPAPTRPAPTRPEWPAVKAKRSVKKANGAALRR
ncbi:MAG: DNA-3-methyladenine glycosylase 2 family protein [Xanthobacteraceae bacterium]|nr:DNA-3-methyladenine glycosylase 2 family protein [Xanthobacteraceae bacterium]